MKYIVSVSVVASQGGMKKSVEVDATNKALAIVAANAELERRGITRWKLDSVFQSAS